MQPNQRFAFRWDVRQGGSHFINDFIYAWVDGSGRDFSTRSDGLFLLLANCLRGVKQGNWRSELLGLHQTGAFDHVIMEILYIFLVHITTPEFAQSIAFLERFSSFRTGFYNQFWKKLHS